jgi:hypothetical protein
MRNKLYTDAAENCSDLVLDEKGSYSKAASVVLNSQLTGHPK